MTQEKEIAPIDQEYIDPQKLTSDKIFEEPSTKLDIDDLRDRAKHNWHRAVSTLLTDQDNYDTDPFEE